YTVGEAQIVDLIYPSYFQYHYLKRPFELELALGAEQPQRKPYVYTEGEKGRNVSKRGESWTFRIKRGLRFQDDPCFPGGKGREITAADFIYSFRRMADPSVNCPVLGFFIDKIIGFAPYYTHNQERAKKKLGADYEMPVAGLQLDPKDPYTFRILLNQPYPQLRYLMAMHFTTPLAHEAVERYGKELARHPVGCGPYRLTEYTRKRRIVLEVNPNRRPEFYPTEGEPGDRAAGLLQDAGKPLPLTEKVVYTTVREAITGWNLFLQGYMDTWSVTQENFRQAISRQGNLTPQMKSKGIRLRRSVDLNISYFAFNMTDPVVGGYTPEKRKLRQAISLAIDAQSFIDLFSQGIGRTAEFLVPPGLFGYDPNYRNPYRRYERQLTRAKQLLAEAGYPGGIDKKTGDRLTIYYDNTATDASGRQEVGLVKKQIEALGLRLESRPWRDIIWQDRVDKGQFQFIRYGWIADYPDAENFVFLLYGPNRRPGPNHAAYNNPEYNRIFERMRAMDDGPERLALIGQLRAIAEEDCPWVFMEHGESLGLGYEWLTNGKPHAMANDTTKYRGINGPLRARRQAEWNQANYWPVVAVMLVLVAGSLPAAATVRQRRTRRLRRETAVPVATGPFGTGPTGSGPEGKV
ncbi:MAG: ABC transporter substrate-binding protein, partial [Armatimonadota bacterium]|nr:ABC transporter substrate-binding protein [Armatimonadota bacterium]